MTHDGLDILIAAPTNDGELIDHLVGNTLFVNPCKVRQQTQQMQAVRITGKLPMRFSSEALAFIDNNLLKFI